MVPLELNGMIATYELPLSVSVNVAKRTAEYVVTAWIPRTVAPLARMSARTLPVDNGDTQSAKLIPGGIKKFALKLMCPSVAMIPSKV